MFHINDLSGNEKLHHKRGTTNSWYILKNTHVSKSHIFFVQVHFQVLKSIFTFQLSSRDWQAAKYKFARKTGFKWKLVSDTWESFFKTSPNHVNSVELINSSNYPKPNHRGISNLLSASAALIWKPVNWFAEQINSLVSIWGQGQHWHLMG